MSAGNRIGGGGVMGTAIPFPSYGIVTPAMRRDQFHDPPEPGMNVGGARFAVRRQGDRRRARCRHRVGYCAIVSCWLDEVFWCRWVDKPLLSGRAPAPNQGPATRRGRFRQCGGPMTADILISLFENALPRIFCICSGPLPLPATHESMLIWVAGRGEGRCREFSNRCQDSTLAPRQEIYLIAGRGPNLGRELNRAGGKYEPKLPEEPHVRYTGRIFRVMLSPR